MTLKQLFDQLCVDIKQKLPDTNVRGLVPSEDGVRYFYIENSTTKQKFVTWLDLDTEKEIDWYNLAIRAAKKQYKMAQPPEIVTIRQDKVILEYYNTVLTFYKTDLL